MRDLLFKGKRKDTGEWVEGGYYLEPYTDKVFIIRWNSMGLGFNEFIECEKDSICEYIGQRGKNGERIWENDIVTGYFNREKITGMILYGSDSSFFIERKGLWGIHLNNAEDWVEVIGNIIDNPDLLKQ